MALKYPMAEGQTRHAPPLSMVRCIGTVLYVAGHGAVNEQGEFVSDDFEEQMHYTMEQLRATLAQEEATFAEVVMVRGYVQNPIESLHNSFGLAIGRNISYFGEFSPLSFYYGLGCWSLLC